MSLKRLKGKKEFIVDEIYTFIGAKRNTHYIWTGLIINENKKYPVFHVSKSKTSDDLDEFVRDLPEFNIVYSDKNPIYKQYYGRKNIAEKGIMTNLVESFNSQLRHYCSKLIRRGKSYAKSAHSLITNLHIVFIQKFIN